MQNIERVSTIQPSQTETIVCDWDGVIQLFFDGCVKNFRKLADKYPQLDLTYYTEENAIHNIVKERNFYNLQLLFKTEEEQKVFAELLEEAYFKQEDFYDDSIFLPFSEGLLQLASSTSCKQIIFLSHTDLEHPQINNSKIKSFERLLEGTMFKDKFRLELLHLSESKGEWIKNNVPEFTTFIDDRADIIMDTIRTNPQPNKTYLIPAYGYNSTPEIYQQLQDLSKEYNVDISYMNNLPPDLTV